MRYHGVNAGYCFSGSGVDPNYQGVRVRALQQPNVQEPWNLDVVGENCSAGCQLDAIDLGCPCTDDAQRAFRGRHSVTSRTAFSTASTGFL
jgi:hypothetical protein